MTFNNALGFLLVSVAMIFAPAVFPSSFPATGLDGTNARAIWLVLMGLVQASVGVAYFSNRFVLPVVLRVASFRPQSVTVGSMLSSSVQSSVI